ncbi:MAG: phosphoadenosine phosphosulfate reductase [Ruminococcus sp.]|nr:phosphoadenosine phosphosulfate reductase [Ruminococcus sp.]
MAKAFETSLDTNNFTIFDSYAKVVSVLSRSATPVCSISGGSDSDIVLDIIHNVGEDRKVHYYWFDTGLEYQATKEHLNFLENKYRIEIERVKACKPIPTCCREYGMPFLSKYVSEQIMRLQLHGFQWEYEPLPELLEKYPNCKIALQWWCNAYYAPKSGVVQMSRFSISRNKWLKEFLIANPPDFKISNKCCEYAKKKPAKLLIKEHFADLDIIGVRKAEGGIRSAAYKTCFSESKTQGYNSYRPVFWYTDKDKKIYEDFYGIQHSRCYTEYGLKRTGCVGCPYNPKVTQELDIIKKH